MSLYNAIFGKNPLSGALLDILGLTVESVGRFRDCYVEMEGDNPIICVYTRNGGGNRNCWHDDSPKYGSQECRHHEEQEEIDEMREVRNGALLTYEKTGKRVLETRYVCEAPGTPECACCGCLIEFRLPKHPNYLGDSDDDFDCTYATIRFSVPESAREMVAALASSAPVPSERWTSMLEALRSNDTTSNPDAARALKVGEAILPQLAKAFEEKPDAP